MKPFRHSALLVLSTALFCQSLVRSAYAGDELSVTEIGTDLTANQTYECVRFADSSLNSINIVDNDSNQTVTFRRKVASRKVRKRINNFGRRIDLVRGRLRAQKRLRRSLLGAGIPDSKAAQKLKRTNEKIADLETKLGQLKSDRSTLRDIATAIRECGELDSTPGNLILYQGTYESDVSSSGEYFYAGIALKLESVPTGHQVVCATVSGNSERITNMGGFYQLEAPEISALSIFQNPCVGTVNNECLARLTGAYAFFAGNGGEEAPGSCTSVLPAFECSLDESVTVLSDRLGQMQVVILGTAASDADCQDF